MCVVPSHQVVFSLSTTDRLALGGRRGLRGRLGLLRHNQRAQLGVGNQHAVVAQREPAHFAKRSYADTKADQVQPGPWHGRLKGALRSPVLSGAA